MEGLLQPELLPPTVCIFIACGIRKQASARFHFLQQGLKFRKVVQLYFMQVYRSLAPEEGIILIVDDFTLTTLTTLGSRDHNFSWISQGLPLGGPCVVKSMKKMHPKP